MSTELTMLLYSVGLAWLMLMTGSMLRARPWRPGGMAIAFSNRDEPIERTPMSARADRAASNMLENLVLFAALVLVAHLAGGDRERIALGATIFFYARVAYWPVYLAGVVYLRTLIWLVSVAGLGLIVSGLL